jgi:broad specificity phosphatase PhoE
MKRMPGILAAIALLWLAAVPLNAQSTVVVLVRHAETTGQPPGDAVLSEAGLARADSLVGVMRDAPPAAVFTTHYARTRQTAEPVLRATGAPHHVLQVSREAREAHITELIDRIRGEYQGGTVLVIGHSNTVPQIIRALGGPEVVIADDEFGRVFTLVLDAAGVRLTAGRYGG